MFHQKKMIGKHFRKIMLQFVLMFCILNKKKYILLMFQKNNSNCEKQVILLIMPNGEKREAKSEGQR